MKEIIYSSETVLRTKKKGKVEGVEGDKKLRKDRLDGDYKGKIAGILLS
jgi:hypothetical protein